jgi:5-methylcytosine-specific restriction endonuclease McrA
MEMNMNCKKCRNKFEPSKGLLNYCSMSCRNSRERSDEVKQKISSTMKSGILSGRIPSFNERLNRMSNEDRENFIRRMREITDEQKAKAKENIMTAPFETLSFERLRKRVIYEQDEKCNSCGIDEWMSKPISLELEHKDGNHHNNLRDNLEALCPNCHSQTPTFRGRNIKGRKQKVLITDDELLIALIQNNFNMRQSLIQVGLAAKGANYNRCHKLKRLYLSQ